MRDLTFQFRTDQEGLDVLRGLAKHMDIGSSGVLRLLVREKARELGVAPDDKGSTSEVAGPEARGRRAASNRAS